MTLADIDMENRIIDVSHQILNYNETGYYITTPKTKNGIRQIPMSETVYDAFVNIPEKQKILKI